MNDGARVYVGNVDLRSLLCVCRVSIYRMSRMHVEAVLHVLVLLRFVLLGADMSMFLC